jgi:uncharacterized damage-inducible protein DinB
MRHDDATIGAPAPRVPTETGTRPSFIASDRLLAHWQGHRRLTRRVIEAFPDEQLFSFSVGGMRPFAEIVLELLAMAAPTVRGVLTNEWQRYRLDEAPTTKAELLRCWDEATAAMDELWPRIPAERFFETQLAYGQFEGVVHDLVLYAIDNEIHHRAQGYVYLRALGTEPPPFWERD